MIVVAKKKNKKSLVLNLDFIEIYTVFPEEYTNVAQSNST